MKWELNFNIGKPIAYVEGGNLNGEIIHLNDVDKEAGGKSIISEERELLIRRFFKKVKENINFVRLNKLMRKLSERNRPDDDEELAGIYDRALLLIDDSKGRELVLKDGMMKLTFDKTEERQIFYIAGPSGAGKSTVASQLAQNYRKMFPEREIYLFSNKPEDPVFDDLGFITRVPLDDDLVDIDLDMLQDSLCIFDDVEALATKKLSNGNKLEKEIENLMDLILTTGRSKHVSMILIRHLACDFRKTRVIINECHAVVVFPQMGVKYANEYFLNRYLGLSKPQVAALTDLPSRSVTIFKVPTCIVHDKGAYLL